MNDGPKFDPAIQSENIAFDKAELVLCTGCGRSNAPNRPQCLYCGHDLEFKGSTDAEVAFGILETWERGFNVILTGGEMSDAAAVARAVGLEPADANVVLDAKQPLPIARVGSENDAGLLKEKLENLGLTCVIISDSDLKSEQPPVRLASIEIGPQQVDLVDFNTRKASRVSNEDISLIVTGTITQSRVDTLEKKGRGKSATLEESSAITDEPVVDIYRRTDPVGFRVNTNGFDFSCLGADKGLIAAANLRSLVGNLSAAGPNVKLVTNYMSARAALTHVWPVEMRNDPKGLRNVRFGKRGFAATTTSDNRDQFNRYSRLQWHLL